MEGNKRPPEKFLEDVGKLCDRLDSAKRPDEAAASKEELQLLVESLRTAIEKLRVAEEDLREKNRELSEIQEQHRELFESVPDGYLVTDFKGCIQKMNQSLLALLNLKMKSELAQNKPFDLFVAPVEKGKFLLRLTEIVSSPAPLKFELSLKPRGLQPIDTEVIASREASSENPAGGIRWIFRDITDRKRCSEAEKELAKMQPLIHLGRMVSAVAHEIRNPLQNIRMGIDTLGMATKNDPEKREILSEIEHGVNLLNSSVMELLEFSRPLEIKPSQWPIGEIFEQALRGASHLLKNVSVTQRSDFLDSKILVDGSKLIQVLINLIKNAVEAMREGQELTLECDFAEREGKRFAALRVSDNGSGISPDVLARIQEPFFTTKLHGNGLGLAICRKIVEAHAGTLQIESEAGKGTTVEILLPA